MYHREEKRFGISAIKGQIAIIDQALETTALRLGNRNFSVGIGWEFPGSRWDDLTIIDTYFNVGPPIGQRS